MLVYTAEEPVGGIVPATAGGSAALLATPKVHDRDSVPEDPTEIIVTAFGTHLSCVVWTAKAGDSVQSLFASHGYDYVDGRAALALLSLSLNHVLVSSRQVMHT